MSTGVENGEAGAGSARRFAPRRSPSPPDATPAPPAGPTGPADLWPAAPPTPPAPGPSAGRAAPRDRHRLPIGVCLVIGAGLLCGAVVGGILADSAASRETAEERSTRIFEVTRGLWHDVPVDTLFPPTLNGPDAGPGGADRTWRRLGVAPDSGCADAMAFDEPLRRALAPVGCVRLLRATYTDATSSSVTTVGLLVTEADQRGMRAFADHWRVAGLGSRTDLLPRPLAVDGTVAEDFGNAQRASWVVRVRTDVPYVGFAVSGFADGRAVPRPEPAARAVRERNTSAVAEAGLGHEARGIETSIARRLTAAAEAARREHDQDPGSDRRGLALRDRTSPGSPAAPHRATPDQGAAEPEVEDRRRQGREG
ncbi:hypothetical protein [Wenjunlia vitaminophila]|uniref:hypothetical protein n=1 Tax=Wenjunlia vitaminophila TaxID=76728 RepID=UPI0003A8C719|nr:hypothetical protein [Wenjunlia vitaminophila]